MYVNSFKHIKLKFFKKEQKIRMHLANNLKWEILEVYYNGYLTHSYFKRIAHVIDKISLDSKNVVKIICLFSYKISLNAYRLSEIKITIIFKKSNLRIFLQVHTHF